MKKILAFLFAMFFIVPVFACANNEIDVLGDGTNCQTAHFTLTTTSTNSFQFIISAAGTFYVDCGNGGNLQGTGASGNIITKNDTTNVTYTCSWGSSVAQTIRFGGSATGYSATTNTAAIIFTIQGGDNALKISGISGSLGAIFGTVNTPSVGISQPVFYSTFLGASNLTGSIPDNLFLGVSGEPVPSMFYNTFYGCSGLTGSIPANLFAGITGTSNSLFQGTFHGCSGLTGSIPATLFSGISGIVKNYMFYRTFRYCSGLTGSIPATLFAGLRGAPDEAMFMGTFQGCSGLSGTIPETLFCQNINNPNSTNCIYGAPKAHIFSSTFSGCSGLSGTIPEKLFTGIRGSGTSNMFASTFSGCGITSIPSGLFSGVSGAAQYMFSRTFTDCKSLTSIPENLFSGVSSAADYLFASTFSGCTNLSGYIPPSTFAGLIANNSPTATDMWGSTFSNTQLDTTCPTGTTQYITGYEDYWNSKVSCVDESFVCDAGEYLPSHWYQCEECSENSYCVGGNYNYSASTTQGITGCNPGYSSPAGSDAASDCTGNVITVTWDGADSEDIAANNAGTVIYGGDIRTPKKAQHINGKVFVGWKFDDPQ